LEAKARLGLDRKRLVDIEALAGIIGRKEHLEQAEMTFNRSITLVRNQDMLLPVPRFGKRIAVFSLSSDPGGYLAGRTFVREVKKRVPFAQTFYAEPSSGREFLDMAVDEALDSDVWIIGLFSRLYSSKGTVGLDEKHVELINDLVQCGKSLVVISFGSPYFLRYFPEVQAYLCAYRYSDGAQAAAVRAVFGEIDITGKLPVSIPDLYSIGHGIMLERQTGPKPEYSK
jgi:beta-N-acetylhexosaminidase